MHSDVIDFPDSGSSKPLVNRRPLSLEDVYWFRVITDVQISPDGDRVAYVVRVADREPDRYRSAVWLVDAEGGTPRQITTGAGEDSQPRWSPDGRWLAFTSDRGHIPAGKSRPARNLFVLDLLAGGEARQLTHFQDDVSLETVYPIIAEAYAWSPDSRQICFVVKDPWPQGTAPPRAYVYDKLRYKSGEDGWWDGRRKHLWLVSVDNGALRQLTCGDSDNYGPVFSPDGSLIAFLSARRFGDALRNTLPDTNPFAPRDIWLMPVDGSTKARCLTDTDGPQLSPSFSPDGQLVAYFGHRDRFGAWDTPAHLWMRPASGGEPRDLLAAWNHPVGSLLYSDTHGILAPPAAVWAPDGQTLYFLGTENNAANLFAVSSHGGTPRAVTSGDHEVVTASFDRQCRRFAALIQDDTAPPDVYVGEIGGELRRVTHVNAAILTQVYTAQAERISYTASDGAELAGIVLMPQNFDHTQRYPLVVELQGGMQFFHGCAYSVEYQLLASCGYVVFLFNPRRPGYGPGWCDQNCADIMAGVDFLINQGYVDPKRIGVTGDGAGGILTNWIIGQTDRFAASVARRSVCDNLADMGADDRAGTGEWEGYFSAIGGDDRATKEDWQEPPTSTTFDPLPLIHASPISYSDRVTTPHLLMHSKRDRRVSVTQAEAFFIALRSLGKIAQLVVLQGGVHFLGRGGAPEDRLTFFRYIVEWFDRYLLCDLDESIDHQ